MAEVVAEPCGLAYMFLQDAVLMRLHFKKPCKLLQLRMSEKDDDTPVKKHIDGHKHREHPGLEQREDP